MSEQDAGAGTPRPQRAEQQGVPVTASVLESGLDIDGSLTDWVDIDRVVEGDHRVLLERAGGSSIELSKLGATHDRFLSELRTARRRARYAALTITSGEPLQSYLARTERGLVDVHLFDKVLVAEQRDGSPVSVPLSLIDDVVRDGYRITIAVRGLDPLVLSGLGTKTDEFLARLAATRRSLTAVTAAAYAEYDGALTGLAAPDGWALTAREAGAFWPALLERAQSGSRANEVRALVERSGDRLAIGLYTDGGSSLLPFVLAPIGDRVVVEATDGDDRATYVFAVSDRERLNAVLLLTSFRREALFLPDDQLGRWAVAARVWPAVREARGALVARIVHDNRWVDHLDEI